MESLTIVCTNLTAPRGAVRSCGLGARGAQGPREPDPGPGLRPTSTVMQLATRMMYPFVAPARERRGAQGPRERPSRGSGRSPD